ncbi:hypothetical protein JHS3_04840 [Jeongeupia sp. HS-3]|uniref:DUF3426 domain-containing protein n=1 Tax=Jeongeupia sp. HS-3 TaxID=1009682 RepID=UPI0018A396E9|nr:DUF3426 domain-containing protein [Jeongeupia sp. HS-3]BCL74748.1 hypothetical protein JHS3_04840 [Jeongeupia sp. HS-3]
MSSITRCPNCHTAFNVTAAQLAAHRGKVRCGKCAFVFNALECMTAQAESPADAPVDPTITEAVADETAVTVEPQHGAPHADNAVVAESPEPEPEPEPEPAVDALASEPASAIVAEPATASAEAAPSDYRPIRTIEDDALLAPPAPPSPWRWIWVAIAALAVFVLLTQIALRYRATLSTELPWLRPIYVSACQSLGCEMPLPRHAELLRSDYSELSYVPGRHNLVQLSASLRNLAAYEQALPTMELTLTNEREEVVARKRFTPSQYLVASEKNRSRLAPNDELRAYLQLDLDKLDSSGYSIYWFYP